MNYIITAGFSVTGGPAGRPTFVTVFHGILENKGRVLILALLLF